MMIQQHLADGVLTLSMQRFDKKNALNLSMYRQLSAALQQAVTQQDVRVVLLQGNEQCFSSGNDLQDFLSAGELNREHPVVEFLYTVAAFPKPLMAAVAGLAIGIGTTVLLHCDLVYAAPGCRMQLPFTHLGLCPEAASSLLLPQVAGYQRAAQYLLLGEAFSSEQAAAFGLVNELVPESELLAYAAGKAKALALLPFEAVMQTKTLLKASQRQVEQVMSAELDEFGKLLRSDDCQRRLQAFFKRK